MKGDEIPIELEASTGEKTMRRVLSLLTRYARITVVAATALVIATPADATTIIYQSVDDLVNKAEGVLIGTVDAVASRRGPDREIYTFVTLRELQVVKGNYRQNTFTLRLEGGHIEGEVVQLVGAPEFTPESRVVVFVRGNGQHSVPLVGWTQGVFRLERADDGSELLLDHDGNGVLSFGGIDLIKEERYAPDARIVGHSLVRQFQSTEAAGSDGSGTPAVQQATTRGPASHARERAMSPQEFIAVIAGKVQQGRVRTASGAPLVSVDDFTGISPGPGADQSGASHSQ